MKKVKTRKFLWTLLPMMAAALMTTACSSDDDSTSVSPNPAADQTVKSIPYTVTVGQGTTTRATVASDDVTLQFADGDKLYVENKNANVYGCLTLQSGAGAYTGATFSGDLYYTGSEPADDLQLTATLVGANDELANVSGNKVMGFENYPTTICATMAEAVQKYSKLTGSSTYGAKSFALSQETAFLKFSVTLEDGTTAGTALGITITNGGSTVRTGSVTTATVSENVVAQFVAAMPAGTTMSSATFQLGTKSAVSFGGTTQLAANKIYNITKTISIPGLLAGAFTVNSDGTQVKFAQGNLRYTSGAWSFFDNQWEYYTTYSASSWDKFGWSTSATTYGMSMDTSKSNSIYSGDFKDWGDAVGSGWRTLSSDEWTYVFNTRTTGGTVFDTEKARYAHATINTDGTSVNGMILFPDGVDIASTEVTTAGSVNNASAWGTKCTSAQWSALAAKGCVFLPAAGYRWPHLTGDFSDTGSIGDYWSSSPNGESYAYGMQFYSGTLNPAIYFDRYLGFSVRLVRQVE